MGRAERRRIRKLEQKAKTATYNLTKEQLDIAVREQVGKELERIKQEATDDAVNTAMVLLLTLPLEVLMDHYWTKTYAKRIPKFTELVLEYYERWQNGELDMEKLKEDLWEYGGVKLVESGGVKGNDIFKSDTTYQLLRNACGYGCKCIQKRRNTRKSEGNMEHFSHYLLDIYYFVIGERKWVLKMIVEEMQRDIQTRLSMKH